jgi:peptidoglycan/LPS O-acetylase OafA/YrhL
MHVKQGRRPTPMRRPGPPRLTTRKDIQGLRAVAVGLVVLDHAGVPFVSGGYVGVDVFFVVSGFLITQILVREASFSGSVSLVKFYARRARRILPASTLVLLVTTLVAGFTLSAAAAKDVVNDVLWASVFGANVHFAQLGADYFSADRTLSPVQHYWSLAVEEQFYLVLPLLILLLVGWGRRRYNAHKSFRSRWVTAAVVGALALGSLAWSIIDTPQSPMTAYFSSFTRAWELGAGVLLALAVPHLGTLSYRRRVLLSGAGLVAIVAAAVTFDASTPFPGWHALVPVLGAVAVLAAGVGDDGHGLGRVLTWRPFTWVGDISYSLYLWHWPALVLVVPLITGDDPEWLVKTVVIGAVVLLSMLTYHLVEQPFRRGKLPGSRGRTAMILWPVSVGVVVLAVLGVNLYQAHLLSERTEEAQRYYSAMEGADSVADEESSIPTLVEEAVQLADDNAPIHFPLVNLDGLSDDHWAEAYPCYAAFRDTTSPFCELGDTDAETTVVAFGDSHMGMWLPALDAIGSSDGFRVVPFVKWACASFDVSTPTTRGPESTCDDYRAWAVDQIRELDPDVILLSNRVLPPNLVVEDNHIVKAWEAGVESMAATMSEIAPDVRIFTDVPRVESDPGDCLSARSSTMATCTVAASERSVQGIIATRIAAERADVPAVNVAALVCFEQRCPLVVDQTVIYRDEDHISMTWGRRLTDELRERLALPALTG